ncbi:pectinesterase family protein, partial [Streptomyces sp. TRM76130]|nr:pectinesterase family protein [Streptomyces sp. TRM76130]
MPRPVPSRPSRRGILLAAAGAGAGAALGLAAGPATASARPRPFGRYGSPAARLTPATLYVDPHGRGDFTSVQAAVTAATGSGRTLVLAPGTYRETVAVDTTRTEATWIGASEDPRDVVIVYDNAAGTPKPDGSGTYGTSGSATTTVTADGFTARWITFANDWLRGDHPDYTGTQAVAIKVQGDRSAFHHCRFLGHQDTLYADTR